MTKNNYYVGVDIGTNSVGWAVTTEAYNIKKFRNKYMHGVRMFEAMETAESRRMHRTARRRLARRKERLDLLQTYFKDEISKVDPNFFIRLEEGFLQEQEQSVKRTHTLFDDASYNDVNYYDEYTTIYHLRNHLMLSKDKEDIRHIYLALHHMMKYRGHFLFHGTLNLEDNILNLLNDLKDLTESIFGVSVYNLESQEDITKFLNIMKDRTLNKTNRTKAIKDFASSEISKNDKHFEEIHKMLCARKSSLKKLFIDTELDEDISIEFDNANIEETLDNLSALKDEDIALVEVLKGIYDWTILQNILDGEASISVAMINSYEKHREELKELKMIIKSIDQDTYRDFFRNETNKNSYAYYVKYGNQHLENMYRQIKNILKKAPEEYNEMITSILLEIERKTYLLKQRIPTNGIIPHQLHLHELKTILANASIHYDFLNHVDDTKLNTKTKIEELFKFRIPYYVGPLNDAHSEDGFAWVKRTKYGKVYPWNFNEMIDVEKTSERFIRRMTNKCSYLLDADVLPKSSLLYEKFMVLNEINNLKINGDNISLSIKQDIYEKLYLNKKMNVTKKRIAKFINSNYPEYVNQELIITGVDDILKSKLKSYHDFKQIFTNDMPEDTILEDIVFWSTIFSDEKKMLRKRINDKYPNTFTEEALNRIEKLNFSGWGRLSKEMLEDILDSKETGEPLSIIQLMYASNYNLMEILSSNFSYQKQIKKSNESVLSNNDVVRYEMLDKLNLPPNVKRPIWQTIKIIQEIEKTQKQAPKRIFIEMAREIGEKGKRTISRKQQLQDFYKSLDKDTDLLDSLKASLDKQTDDSLRKRKVFLYYKQLGRCLYSGQTIHFKDLLNNTIYDIDHIYPRSVTADDSLSNLALVLKEYNLLKKDDYPVHVDWQRHMHPLWIQLKKSGLMEQSTYTRLTRKNGLSPEELSDFVARQLVETRQATKAVLTILKQIYPNTEVITIKAQHIDKFRQDNKIVKVRSLNDLHHAKDAYLAVVVGNVYYEKFTSDPRSYVKNAKYRAYNLTKVLDTETEDRDVYSRSTGEVVWKSGPEGSIKRIRSVLKNNDILTTYMIMARSGELFDQNPVAKAKKRVPLHSNLDTERYGGYHKASYSHYVLIERSMGKKIVRTIEPILLHLKNKLKTDEDLKTYLENQVNYKDVVIIDNYIPAVNTLLEYDGGRHRITGVSSQMYLMRNETQTFLDDKFIEKWKIIDNIKTKDRVDLLKKITEIDLSYLYDGIQEKMLLPQHATRLELFYQLTVNNKESFEVLDKKEKVNTLWELIKLLKSTRESSNLSKVGGSQSSGINTLGRNISNKETIYLIEQSITGLYEKRINLLK